MGFLDNVKNMFSNNTLDGNYYADRNFSENNRIVTDIYDGEKTPGELGDVLDTTPDHIKLRLRSYDLLLKTDLVGIITGKFFKWILGSGLKVQAEPNKTVLEMFGVNEDLKTFQKNTEALFNLYSNSKFSDYNKNDWFHEKANEALKSAFLGGDSLCVLRVDDFGVNMQVVDGQHVATPSDENEVLKQREYGNKIVHGIEIDKKGSHVAFYVLTNTENKEDIFNEKYERVKAVDSKGRTMAWMIYGTKHRIDSVRGIPFISSIMEKVSKLDRYSEASVSKAEQTANLIYTIEHDNDSTGQNPINNFGSKKNVGGDTTKTSYELSGRTCNLIKQSTSNQVYNMPIGAKVKSFAGESETQYPEFFKAVFHALCASVDIPPEVALQYYEQNYSSSRAAINSWEHIVEVYRQKFAKKFYHNFYRVFLEHEILKGNIIAPGFLVALRKNNFMVIEAYVNARFIGKKMPHIDPLKEAKAARVVLGDDSTPLASREQATEMLGLGEWSENYSKSLEEDKLIPKEENTDESGDTQGTE